MGTVIETKPDWPPVVEPVEHPSIGQQYCISGDGARWAVSRLIECAKGLPEFDLPLAHMDLSDYIWNECTPRLMAGHIKAMQQADMSKPIILCENGSVLDGRHRIMRALVEGHATIKAVRFEQDPPPCKVDE